MKSKITILFVFAAIFCIACRSAEISNTPNHADTTTEEIATPDLDIPLDLEVNVQSSAPVRSVEYYTNNHACPRLHTDEACRKEAMLYGMLMQVSLIDTHQNELNFSFFDYKDISDNLLEGSLLEWYQTYHHDFKLFSNSGRVNENIHNDLYKRALKHIILAPQERNIYSKSMYYELSDFGPENQKSFITHDTSGRPVTLDDYSTPYTKEKFDQLEAELQKELYPSETLYPESSDQEPRLPYYTDPNGRQWKYVVQHTFDYDEQGRLKTHTSKYQEYFRPTFFDEYEYMPDNETCMSAMSHYNPGHNGKRYLIYKIQYLDSSPEALRYLSIEQQCEDNTKSNCINGTPAIWEETRRDCPEQLEWIIPDAITQYDRKKNTWISKRENISSKPTENGKYYSPDKPFDYNDVVKHYYEYELDPRYSFEPRDYTLLTDPDAAHPSRPFKMAPTPVTQKAFSDIMGFNPSYFQSCGETCPVENVTWYQALAYSNALSEKEKRETCYELRNCSEKFETCEEVLFKGLDCKGYRLPTDEEWRSKAASIEKKIKKIYDHTYKNWFDRERKKNGIHDEGLIQLASLAEDVASDAAKDYRKSIAWTVENSENNIEKCGMMTARRDHSHYYQFACVAPHPVGQKKADPNGLYDLYGNVFEWIWDWYGYTSRSGDSLGPDRGYCRIMRGGSVFTEVWVIDHRFCYPPDRSSSVLGFRLVRTL